MLHTAALPFVLHRDHSAVSGFEVTSIREQLHGLLRLDGDRLVIQWRTAREITRTGREVRTDRELAPIREVAIPLSGLAGAHVRRAWRRWWLREVLVLTAADLRAFDALTGEADVPGLVLEHPAEIVVELRRSDQQLAREFVGELRLAISEHMLSAFEEAPDERLPSGPSLSLPDVEVVEQERLPSEVQQKVQQKV